jgi:integrase
VKSNVYRRKIRGKWFYVVDQTRDGVRKRRFFSDKRLADAEIATWNDLPGAAADEWLNVSPKDRRDLLELLAQCKAASIDVAQVWSGFKAANKPHERMALEKAIEAFIDTKTGSNRRKIYVSALKSTLNSLKKGRLEKTVDQISAKEIDEWIGAHAWGAYAKSIQLARLRVFFRWCQRKRWCQADPTGSIETPKHEHKTPTIWTVKEVATVLESALQMSKRLCGYVALGVFAGIRPHELHRLAWEQVDLKEARVLLDAGMSKVRQRRVVPLTAAAIAWLQACGELKGPVAGKFSTFRRIRRKLVTIANISWPADIMRHTCASYWLAMEPDVNVVARALGNSPAILWRHYHALTTRENAEKFWNLRPRDTTLP